MATITIKYDIQIGATVSIRVAAMAGGYWGSILFSFEATAMWEWSLGRGAAKQKMLTSSIWWILRYNWQSAMENNNLLFWDANGSSGKPFSNSLTITFE
jgi:hypothetical protein